MGVYNEILTPTEALKEVRICLSLYQVVKICTLLTEEEEDMIDTRVVSHCIAINPSSKPMAQRKQKLGEEKRVSIDGKVGNLSNSGFITEIKYPTWLAYVVLVRKAANKWHMCVDLLSIYPRVTIF